MSAGPPLAALGTRVPPVLHAQSPGVAALVLAFELVVPAIAFLSSLDDLVAAESAGGGGEAVPLLVVFDGVEDLGDVADAASGEFAVVRSITAGRRCEHYEVAVKAAWSAFWRVIVLECTEIRVYPV